MPSPRSILGPWLALGPLLFGVAAGAEGIAREGAAPDFRREVRPLLSRSCFACHGPDEASRRGGLRLDRREDALAPREGGAALVPGSRERSLLWRRITAAEGERMPPPEHGPPLAPEEIELLGRWIDAGAPYATHWSFAPLARPEVPAAAGPDAGPIDAFVLRALAREGLAPLPEADRWALGRRVSLDLTGLPPDPGRLAAFVADPAPDAYARYVDELLASPAHAEHLAARWLDLARYADSKGYGSDPLREIWAFRDWLIDAFAANLPFDEFTIRLLAGDLLPHPSTADLVATAFHRNTMTNTEGGTDDEEFRVAAVMDRAETTAQVWMGLTLRCARCHSHKFDPISQEEYYRFYAFFDQTEDADRDDDAPTIETPTPAQRARREALDRAIAALEADLAAPGPDAREAVRRWEEERAAAERRWVPLLPERASSAAGARIEVDARDASLRLVGAAPDTDTLALTFAPVLERVTALRIEALADPALPGGGPGLSPGNGNFVLNEARLVVLDARPPPVRGRYVRVSLPGPGRFLSLAEVEVHAGGVNLARGARATQSSTDYGGEAARAVDGNTDGRYDVAFSVTHTRLEREPWWEVDLGAERPLERITIWNRTDGELEQRLAGAVVTVLDEERRPRWCARLAEAPDPSVALDLGAPTRELAFAEASADFAQADFGAALAIDGDAGARSGWAIGPRQGEDHALALALAAPAEGRPALALHLAQTFGGAHVLGRLRILATDADEPPEALPAELVEYLATPPERRDEEAWAALAAHVRARDPALAPRRAELARLRAERAALAIARTPVMRELPPERRRTTRLLEKGNFLTPGKVVEPDVPAFLPPLPADAPRDRLGLARWLVSPEHPLTARVEANRLWALCFGRGLVATPEDFGAQGTPPSHPELLDWLACELEERGWDRRAVLREIVLSAAYRRSALAPAALRRADPQDVWLAYARRPRLPAEAIRDQALALAGLLSPKVGGPSVFPPQPPGLWRAAFNGADRKWPTSEGEDRYRRALYTFWRRTVPYPSLAAFDVPSREVCTSRRRTTNTPLAAFVTLNDPAFVEAAQALARRIVREGGEDDAQRARFGLELCLARPAEAREVDALVRLVADARAHLAADADSARRLASEPLGALPDGADPLELAAWTAAANVLLNLDGVLTRS